MADAGHYIERCKHGVVVSQCRCPGPRTEYVTDCPEGCRIAALEAENAKLREAIRGWANVIEIQDMREDAADAVTVAQVIVKEMRAMDGNRVES